MLSKAIVLLASISAALAIPFITNPTATTTFTGGQQAEIRWQDSGDSPNLEAYGPCKISIYVGNALQQTSLQTLSDNTDVSKVSSLQFTPDASIGPDSGEYFIRIESIALKDDSPQKYPAMAFSAKFNLSGMSGQFSQAAQDQIKGQTTAPLNAPTATGRTASATGSGSAAAASTTSKPATSGSAAAASASASKKAATASGAASHLTASAGLASALLSALVGVTLF